METTTITTKTTDRRAAVNALAIVGFIALIIIGIGLAIYTARFAPKIASKFGGAAVSFTSVFHKNTEPAQLQVITATTTLPIIDETSTTTVASSTTEAPVTHTTGGVQTTTVVTTVPVAPRGDSDLAVTITDVGYVRRDGDTDTFVSSTVIPSGRDGAVKFTVTNVGTNVTGSWKFEVDVPTSSSQDFTSPSQDSLAPGDSVDYTLGFENGKKGTGRDIVVTVDPTDKIHESNERNNDSSREVDIRG